MLSAGNGICCCSSHILYSGCWYRGMCTCLQVWMPFLFVTAVWMARFLSDDLLVTSYSKDSIKPALPLREAHYSSWNSGFDSVRVWYMFLWSLHLHLFWQGTMWEEEGVIFKWCCFAVRVKVNLPAQDLKLTSPQVVWDSGENEPVIFVGNLQSHI